MMGHREKHGGIEGEAFTGWRRYVGWRRGALRLIKRRYGKRVRRAGDRQTRQEAGQEPD